MSNKNNTQAMIAKSRTFDCEILGKENQSLKEKNKQLFDALQEAELILINGDYPRSALDPRFEKIQMAIRNNQEKQNA